MCGIVGYVGGKKCRQLLLQGLARSEYRGYDSAGIVCIDSQHHHFCYKKEVGSVALFEEHLQKVRFDGHIGMGHTRWATHGVVDKNNAHPHFNCEKTVAVVHNGIVEGFEELHTDLVKKGHVFESSTDTEVIAHYFSFLVKQMSSLHDAIKCLTKKLQGAYALVILMEQYPDQLILIRNKSPLSVNIGNNEMFVASDFVAYSDKTPKVLFLPDRSFAFVKKDTIDLYDFAGKTLPVMPQDIDCTFNTTDKQGFKHYMLKEIYEQKRAIMRTISFCKAIGSSSGKVSVPSDLDLYRASRMGLEYNDAIWRQLGHTVDQIKNLKYINLIAAGTSWHAARIAQFFFEIVCKIPAKVYLASEFRYMPFFFEKNSSYVLISQSGETADTLQALRLINSFDQPTIALTNVASSTIVREASGFLPMQAGPEISVASTKAFSTQLATLYWLAHRIAFEKKLITWRDMHEAEDISYLLRKSLRLIMQSIIDLFFWAGI